MQIHGDVTRGEGEMRPEERRRLVRLSDSDLEISDPRQDIRGRRVVNTNGNDMGTVDDLFIDEVERKVRFLRVGSGGFLGIGESHFLLPVDAVTRVDAHAVYVNQSTETIKSGPRYDPALADEPEWAGYYDYYGYTPYWYAGYRYPGFMI